MSKINGYNSKEKLKSRKALELLFAKGKSFSVFPIKVFYTATSVAVNIDDNGGMLNAATSIVTTDNDSMVQAGVGVSARNFKKAVERNRIKRLLREVYRTQKQAFIASATTKQLRVDAFFLYIGKEIPTHAELNTSMEKVLQKFQEKISKDQTIVSESKPSESIVHPAPTATDNNGTIDSVNNPTQ